MKIKPLRIFVFALIAAALLSPLDYLQVLTGVRTLGGDFWTTPIKFSIVGALLGLLSTWLDPRPHPSKWFCAVGYASIFAAAYFTTYLFVAFPAVIFVMLVLNIMAQLSIATVSDIKLKEIFPFVILMGIAGPLAEYIDIKLGGFEYVGFPGTIPYWLPLLWMSGAFLVRALVGEKELNQ